VYELNNAAATLAREAADGSMERDPASRASRGRARADQQDRVHPPESTIRAPQHLFDELVAAYGEALKGLADGGADLILSDHLHT